MKKDKTNRSPKGILYWIFIWLIAVNSTYAQVSGIDEKTDSTINTILNSIHSLIISPEPVFKYNSNQEIDPEAFADLGFEQTYENVSHTFIMRDGTKLFAYKYSCESQTTVILLHGVLSGAYMMNKTAGLLKKSLNANVYAIDIRGHGQSEGTPGDVDYINQYADDLGDVIAIVKKRNPDGKVIIAGHSMGGGITLRYAMLKNVPEVDGYLLFAPLLGHNSPTIAASANNKKGNQDFMKIHLSRMIGLKLINSLGDNQYNSLPVLFFNLPQEMPLKSYSYRANESMAPTDYKQGLTAVKKPLLVLVGSNDEAFPYTEYEPAVQKYSDGNVAVINGSTHNGIRHSEKAMEKVNEWAKENHLFAD